MPRAIPPTPESVIQKQCLDYLQIAGFVVWRTNSGTMKRHGADGKVQYVRFTGAKGCSDAIGLLRPSGRFLALEFKRVGKKTSPEQQAFLDRITSQGGLALVVTGVEDLRRQLRENGVAAP